MQHIRQKIIAAFLLLSLTSGVLAAPLLARAVSIGDISTIAGVASGKCGGLIGSIASGIGRLGQAALDKIKGRVAKKAKDKAKDTAEDAAGAVTSFFGSVPVEVQGDVKKDIEKIKKETKETQDETEELRKKECVLDPLVKIITGSLISAMTSKIVGWIQGEGGKNVGYVGDFEKTLRHELNVRSGEFINQLAGVNLCGNVRPFLRIALGTPQGLRRSLGCSVTGIVDNVEDFFNDFKKGGWDAFISVSINPQNNPYGAYLIAMDASIQAQDERRRSIEAGYQAGGAFLGFRVPEEVCEPVSVEELAYNLNATPGITPEEIGYKRDPNNPNDYVTCYNRYVTKTPGQTVVSLLNKSIGAGIDSAISADEIDEAFSSIITALINRIIGQSAGVFRDGVFRSGSGGILEDTELADTQSRAFNQEIASEPEEEGGTGGGGSGGGTGGGGTGGGDGGGGTGGPGGSFTNEQQVKLILDIVAEVKRLQNGIATLDNSFNIEVQTLLPGIRDLLTEKAKSTPDSGVVSQLTTTVNNSTAKLTSLLADRNSFVNTKNSLLDEANLVKALSVIDAAAFQEIRQSVDTKIQLITATLTNKGLSTAYPDPESVPVNNFISFIQEEGQEAYRVSGRAANFKNTDFPTIVFPVLSTAKKTDLTARLGELSSYIDISVADIQELNNFLSTNTDLSNGDFPQPQLFRKQVLDTVMDLTTQENSMDSLIIQIVKSAAQ